MTLQVIGAGFGRTGTMSLKYALERIGFGPCYHMMEALQNPSHPAVWARAVAGDPVDWDALFAGYAAAIDWPAAEFWPELIEVYPEARVILTLREPDGWLRSIQSTIIAALRGPIPDDPARREQRLVNRQLILNRVFGGCFDEPGHAVDVFNRNIAAVRDRVPAERLLEYRPGDGWEPLCAFLGAKVPDEPYPRVNSTDEFQGRWAEREGQTRTG